MAASPLAETQVQVPAPVSWPKRVAFVHDWVTTYAGSERVLEQMLRIFPEADVFTLFNFVDKSNERFIPGPMHTSFLQHIPLMRSRYRWFLPLMPFAVEQFDLSGYDLVVSSSHAVAKGVITGPDQLHVCMCYSPIRYAWDLQHQYLRDSGLQDGIRGWIARLVLHQIRMWDVRTGNGVDEFIAISNFIARRIRKAYGREATVIYPPVDTDRFTLRAQKDDFYLTASRMVPYKKIPLIVEAFSDMPKEKLVVIGDGPEYSKARAIAGPNIQFLGYQPFDVLCDHMQRAKAFVFAAEEDFGIIPLEAQACGTAVIAFARGGSSETIRGLETERPTGVFFGEQTVTAIRQAVHLYQGASGRITPDSCRANAVRFGVRRFQREFSQFIAKCWESFQSRP